MKQHSFRRENNTHIYKEISYALFDCRLFCYFIFWLLCSLVGLEMIEPGLCQFFLHKMRWELYLKHLSIFCFDSIRSYYLSFSAVSYNCFDLCIRKVSSVQNWKKFLCQIAGHFSWFVRITEFLTKQVI